jgi:hypothetical protein
LHRLGERLFPKVVQARANPREPSREAILKVEERMSAILQEISKREDGNAFSSRLCWNGRSVGEMTELLIQFACGRLNSLPEGFSFMPMPQIYQSERMHGMDLTLYMTRPRQKGESDWNPEPVPVVSVAYTSDEVGDKESGPAEMLTWHAVQGSADALVHARYLCDIDKSEVPPSVDTWIEE